MVADETALKSLEDALAQLRSPLMREAYLVLSNLRDADLFRLFAGDDADTILLRSAPAGTEHAEAIRKVKILQDLRSIGRKVGA